MTVQDIIKQVRFCIDEEPMDGASFHNASADDDVRMNHIIESKIGDAMRWLCVYAPADILGGSDEEGRGTGVLVDASLSASSVSSGDVESTRIPVLVQGTGCWKLRMPTDFIKLSRVRVSGWSRSVSSPITEDSDEYLQLSDEHGAEATNDRPVAALIDKARKEIELWPSGDEAPSVEVTYVVSTDGERFTKDGASSIAVPPAARTSFIYYLAFLLLSAYNDPRATAMFEIAKLNLGRNG